MIDKALAHKIVNKLRGKEIRPSDVLEAILLYEYSLGLETIIDGCRKSSKVFKVRIAKLKKQRKKLKEDVTKLQNTIEYIDQWLI